MNKREKKKQIRMLEKELESLRNQREFLNLKIRLVRNLLKSLKDK